MTTPAKSELDAARERLELRAFEAEELHKAGRTPIFAQDWKDLRLVLDALKEAERVADAGKRVATYFARSELDRVKSRVEAQQGRYPSYEALPDCLALENWRKPQ